ncbi:uncharacterized protein [Amphiura filiformis]|uniref:uncharacterized protein isoform X2 n=1 Tax=Amphiura filiformis TaxID=82378 RepID=UPI003B21A8A0
MDIPSLDGMKRAELQKLAKEAGIKANKKTEYLISELKKYYSNSPNDSSGRDEKSEADNTSSSHTEITECETSAESEVEAKPKVTRGRRGRKAASRKQATRLVSDSEADTTVSTESEADEPPAAADTTQEAHEADTESPSPPKRKTKRGRRGRKRAATPSPTKDATPAKIQKAASPIQAITAKTTPSPNVTVKTTRGSSSRRATKKTATPVVDKAPVPSEATPEVTTPEATKPATRGSSGRKATKKRRSTFEIDPVTGTPKPSSEEKKEVKVESDPKMKEAVVAQVAEQKPKQPSTRIPKLKFGKPVTKPVTPGSKNWAKIHAARMEKMESIDDYLERKRKRTENLCASVKRAKIVAEEAKAAMETLKAHKTPPVKGKLGPKIVKPVSKPAVNFMSPRPTSKPGLMGHKSAKTPAAPGTATKSVSFKVSNLKTPKAVMGDGKTRCQKRISTPAANKVLSARKSVGDAAEKRKSLNASTRKSMGDVRKSVGGGTTPYKFGDTKNTTTPARKATFDLKASLSKGLTYKPYTGKLKPLGDTTTNRFAQPKTKPGVPSNAKVQLKMHGNITKAKAELKRPKVMSREQRRAGAQKHRAGKRADDLMARRGIKS